MIDKLGINFNSEVVKWKEEVEFRCKVNRCISLIKEELDHSNDQAFDNADLKKRVETKLNHPLDISVLKKSVDLVNKLQKDQRTRTQQVEDWHTVRTLYQVLYDNFFDVQSAGDVGSMASNMNVINCSNEKTPKAEDNYNSCKEYVDMETSALIVAAALKYFGLENLNSPAEEFIPPLILNGSDQQKRKWLHYHVNTLLEKFVMIEQVKVHDDMRPAVAAANLRVTRAQYFCRVCDKSYVYMKSRDMHELKAHGVTYLERQQNMKEDAETRESNESSDDSLLADEPLYFQ
ncbi:uncharacterized protein LOC125560742 [Nematostella vectensis]|uniref:uncharacterized protein LOC125560742 n=1 Tax=Nematostella vectensis TaxID=45351 RepID=UPI002076DA12|nr:uncharacterized protein LOC125560742 [Nematostella vectensis]